MTHNNVLNFVKNVIKNMPANWLSLTTHRLDIYEEKLAKSQFLDHFETLFESNNSDSSALNELPTAYDYIRLGHPLSCVLEWTIAKQNNTSPKNVISFSSKTIAILAVLRKNLLSKTNTRIVYTGALPDNFNATLLKNIYGYQFELIHEDDEAAKSAFNGSTIFIAEQENISSFDLKPNIDFFINYHPKLGSIIMTSAANESYVSEIQHVRRRETIAMTPHNALLALNHILEKSPFEDDDTVYTNKQTVIDTVAEITGSTSKAIVASSGLSMQYAIAMGLIHQGE